MSDKELVDSIDLPDGEWAIWTEGYRATGESGTAKFHGTEKGETFNEAVLRWVVKHVQERMLEHAEEAESAEEFISMLGGYGKDANVEFPRERLTWPGCWYDVDGDVITMWGCRFFPSEGEARERFG